MHFDVANIQWVIVGIPHYPSEDAGLVTLVRSRDTVSLTAMIRGRANNDPKNWVIIGLCVFKALEDDRSNCIGSAVPIGTIIEGVAIPCFAARVSYVACPVGIKRKDVGEAYLLWTRSVHDPGQRSCLDW